MWGTVLKRDLLGETREEDKFHTREHLDDYIKSEIERQGKNVVIRNLDVSPIENLSGLFYKITDGVESLDLSGWKTSGVVNISDMFYSLYNLKEVNLSGWDTSNVKNMSDMFCYCSSLESLDTSGWDTSNVEDMSGMFYNCSCLKSLDLSGWDTSNVKDMGSMFWFCPARYAVVDNKIVKK